MSAVLRNPTFARLFAAQVVALLGTGLLTVALGLLAYDLAGSGAGAVLGTALAVKMGAYVVVAPVISALTYRVSRRRLLVGSNVVRGAIALLLPLIDQTWQIYVLIFVLQAASATFTPAFQSVLPEVLADEEDYTRGLSLSRLAYDLESLCSPIVAAAMLAVMTYNGLFFGTVAGFLMSAVLVISTRIPAISGRNANDTLWQRTTEGMRVMIARPVLRSLLALNMVVATATGLVVVNSVIYIHDVLDASNSMLALLLACYGGGSMIVALALPTLLRWVPDRRIMLTGATAIPVLLAATTGLLTAHPPPQLGWFGFVPVWILLGAATSLINTPSARLLRYQSDPQNHSAVFTAQFSLSHACFFVTYLLAGWLGATAGQPAAAGALGVLAALAAVIASRAWPAHKTLNTDDRQLVAATS
ncbi:MFS transporter [Mycobacterium sp. pV006]|uniref:MFS transporter n=1 Tax=Mycobacterium sp. pV006 TaxID=3238983 RepID=UPI00351B8BDD